MVGVFLQECVSRLASGTEYWTVVDKGLFCVVVVGGMELLRTIGMITGKRMKLADIPVRGQHLDEFTFKDKLFIAHSKIQTGPFLYFLVAYCSHEPNMVWTPNHISLQTLLLPLPILFLVFDFFYTILHWFLHTKMMYGSIHKHHHTQKAPSRATEDAINVHPVEFVLGEYNHLWSVYLYCNVFGLPMHILTVLVFLVTGGILAGWNHTRFDIILPTPRAPLFDSKAHDVHHRIPQCNYGQYTMFWDTVFGTYRPYDPSDRINPRAQLDPRTGLSMDCSLRKRS